jgi:hypothetical protein
MMSQRKRILVVYPVEFKSYEKLVRKLDYYTSKIPEFELVKFEDYNCLLAKYATEKSLELSSFFDEHSSDYQRINFAVIFEDERYPISGIPSVLPMGLKIRKVSLMITRVANIDREAVAKDQSYYEYIGRGSYWGNPYSMYDAGESREEVIRKYKYDFDFDKFPNKKKQRVVELRGKTLGCHCKPAACHGDVLADYLNSLDDGL